ncbi:type II toxin-antitoxin system PemK/MazF family toxin [Candidatus Woesearchaeota archaeon]|nr:type II toxin-antitoxin system PemK/MazF family toxin [Candidatus Woesearchaeota archaeon]
MNKGEVWVVEIPPSNGHEQAGGRPAIIIADTNSNIAVVIPLTSNLQALRFPRTIEIKPGSGNGLSSISVALIFHIRAIDKKRLIKKIGDIGPGTRREIDHQLKSFLQLNQHNG